jgi:hypothetical protein
VPEQIHVSIANSSSTELSLLVTCWSAVPGDSLLLEWGAGTLLLELPFDGIAKYPLYLLAT